MIDVIESVVGSLDEAPHMAEVRVVGVGDSLTFWVVAVDLGIIIAHKVHCVMCVEAFADEPRLHARYANIVPPLVQLLEHGRHFLLLEVAKHDAHGAERQLQFLAQRGASQRPQRLEVDTFVRSLSDARRKRL